MLFKYLQITGPIKKKEKRKHGKKRLVVKVIILSEINSRCQMKLVDTTRWRKLNISVFIKTRLIWSNNSFLIIFLKKISIADIFTQYVEKRVYQQSVSSYSFIRKSAHSPCISNLEKKRFDHCTCMHVTWQDFATFIKSKCRISNKLKIQKWCMFK